MDIVISRVVKYGVEIADLRHVTGVESEGTLGERQGRVYTQLSLRGETRKGVHPKGETRKGVHPIES